MPEVNPILQVFGYKNPLNLSALSCLSSGALTDQGESYFKGTHERHKETFLLKKQKTETNKKGTSDIAYSSP